MLKDILENVLILLDQSVPFNEVIVVDDGSTDSSFDIISQYSDLPG